MNIFINKEFILDIISQSIIYSSMSAFIATLVGFLQAYIIHKKENSFLKKIIHFFIILHLSFSPSNIIYIGVDPIVKTKNDLVYVKLKTP